MGIFNHQSKFNASSGALLKNNAPNMNQSNGFNKPKLLHDTMEVRAFAQVYKLDPSSFTKATMFWVKENLCSTSYNLKVITALDVFATSNKLMVTCYISQSFELKLTITTKTSCTPFDIHKSII
jgi:hypothetical protein